MNYYNLIRTLKSLSLTHSLVNDYAEGDVYEYMNSGMHKYPCVFMTMNNITSDSESTNYNFTMFYIDRLISDGSNKINVQSIGVQVIKQILSKLFDIYPEIEISSTEYTPFTEKFADDCAGVFCQISLSDELDAASYEVDCVEQNFETKELTIKENGIYEVLGYDKVIVSIDGGDCADCSEFEEIIAEQTTTIESLGGQVDYLTNQNEILEVEIGEKDSQISDLNSQIQSVTSNTFISNGTFTAPEGVLGWNEITINVPATDCPTCPEGPDCSEYQEIISEQTSTIENLNQQNQNLQQNVDTLTSENQYLESEKQLLEAENNELANEVAEKDTQISNLNGQIATVTNKKIVGNGIYTPPAGVLGWNEVWVEIPRPDLSVTENGEYVCPGNGGYWRVIVKVPTTITTTMTQTEYDALTSYDQNTIYLITE